MGSTAQIILDQIPRLTLAKLGVNRAGLGDNYLTLYVNGKRGHKTRLTIILTPNDDYTLTITETRGQTLTVKQVMHGVYCDELGDCLEELYAQHINDHCDGFIPL